MYVDYVLVAILCYGMFVDVCLGVFELLILRLNLILCSDLRC